MRSLWRTLTPRSWAPLSLPWLTLTRCVPVPLCVRVATPARRTVPQVLCRVPASQCSFDAPLRACACVCVQLRWAPAPLPADEARVTFLKGMYTMSGAGDCMSKSGMAVHMYACNASMVNECMYNSDGDMLIVPQQGTLLLQTEMGYLQVAPREIVVVPRGITFRVEVTEASRGYICEVFGGHFQLPDLGPIGANGLANARDFLFPVAAYEDVDVDFVVYNKYGGKLFKSVVHHSPFNVVAWHGTYAPYKYDLEKFNTMNSVSYDHPDPSIYTVLTCPTDTPGVALCDFVIFPPRWMVMEHSFRPPYYHRNTMTEFMGMVWGKYDAKVGFQPGGASLHSCMTPHGPDEPTFMKASHADLTPEYFAGGLAFMFETTLMMKIARSALEAPHLDREYAKCWAKLPRVFDPARRVIETFEARPTAAAEGSRGTAVGPWTGSGESALLKK
ncbi:homogentisate 1,2-dioxygenase [archaeon]|nr:MAG: homogentisate 1,2-dioxygenase [archaeon]